MELATASKSVATRSIPVRAIAIAVIYSIYPFAGFLNANRSDGATPGALLPYTLIILLPSLALLLVVHLRRGEQAAARAAVVLAAAVYLLFSYSNLGRAMSKAGISSHQIVLWVLVFVVGVAVTYVLSKYEIAALYVLAAGALLTAVPVVQYVAYRADASSENREAG